MRRGGGRGGSGGHNRPFGPSGACRNLLSMYNHESSYIFVKTCIICIYILNFQAVLRSLIDSYTNGYTKPSPHCQTLTKSTFMAVLFAHVFPHCASLLCQKSSDALGLVFAHGLPPTASGK